MKRINSHIPKIFFRLNGIKFGKKIKLHGWCLMFRFPKAQIILKENITINSSFFSNFIGLYQRTIIVARDRGEIIIGNNVGMSGVTIYAREKVFIDDNTIIGANTKIFDNDFHSLDVEERNNNIFENLACKPIKIGKNVFIGCNCILLKGTEIGDNCIIGAGSVVHGKFGDNLIIAGNPAKIIKVAEKNMQ